jgi:hypothetical protein
MIPAVCQPPFPERLSSSVLRQITYQLRNSDEVKAVLGDRVHYADNAWGELNVVTSCGVYHVT